MKKNESVNSLFMAAISKAESGRGKSLTHSSQISFFFFITRGRANEKNKEEMAKIRILIKLRKNLSFSDKIFFFFGVNDVELHSLFSFSKKATFLSSSEKCEKLFPIVENSLVRFDSSLSVSREEETFSCPDRKLHPIISISPIFSHLFFRKRCDTRDTLTRCNEEKKFSMNLLPPAVCAFRWNFSTHSWTLWR